MTHLMNNGSEPHAVSTVTAVRGNVVDVPFSVNAPSLPSVFRTGKNGIIFFKVPAQEHYTVRAIVRC